MLALDIGGANLKASDGEARSVSRPFAIWRHPERLTDELRSLLRDWPDCRGLAVTMTAELADCFATKAEGVDRILHAVEAVAAGRPVFVWQTGGEFLTPREARELWPLVAASNWHALATWTARLLGTEAGLLIDIGSTTTDLIPVSAGMPYSRGLTDLERLQSGELVYLGVKRTPLCAVASLVPVRGGECPLAAELFATTYDLFLLTGDLLEDASDHETADGRPATRSDAHSRLAHLLCCDATEVPLADAISIAESLRQTVYDRLKRGIERVASSLESPPQGLILSGEGEFAARSVIPTVSEFDGLPLHSLGELLGPAHSGAACAFALSRLANERCVV